MKNLLLLDSDNSKKKMQIICFGPVSSPQVLISTSRALADTQKKTGNSLSLNPCSLSPPPLHLESTLLKRYISRYLSCSSLEEENMHTPFFFCIWSQDLVFCDPFYEAFQSSQICRLCAAIGGII